MKEPKKFLNPKYTQIAVYVIVTALILHLLFQLTESPMVFLQAVGNVVTWLGIIGKPLAAGFAIAYLLYPMAGFFERRLDILRERIPARTRRSCRSSRGPAVAITLSLIFIIFFIIFSVLISTVSRELRLASFDSLEIFFGGIAETVQSFQTAAMAALDQLHIPSADLNNYIQNIGTRLLSGIQAIGNGFLISTGSIAGFFSNLLFSIIFAIYFLLDGNGLIRYWTRVFKTICSERVYNITSDFFNEADRVFSGYVRGQMLDALFMAVMVSIALSIVGIRYSVIIGILTGIGNLIPYVGPFVAYASTIIVSFIGWDPERLAIAILTLFIIQTIDGNVINPKLLSSNVNIHPMLVIASLLIGNAIGGVAGMLFAVPCGGLVKIYFEKLINHIAKKKQL